MTAANQHDFDPSTWYCRKCGAWVLAAQYQCTNTKANPYTQIYAQPQPTPAQRAVQRAIGIVSRT